MAASVVPGKPDIPAPFVSALVADLAARGLTVAVAESLTGGLLTAELIRPAGASAVVLGGIVAYDTELKASVLGVDSDLLEREGPVHPQVAEQMAANVRTVLAVGGRPADIGVATTGVAGPDPHAGQPVGTVYLGLSAGDGAQSRLLRFDGARDQIRAQVVSAAVAWIAEEI